MFYSVWSFFKEADRQWCLNTAEQVLLANKLTIQDPAGDADIHVAGTGRTADLLVTVVCTRIKDHPTSVVVHAVATTPGTARAAGKAVRDGIIRTTPLADPDTNEVRPEP